MVGGHTQFLTKAQGMPMHIEEALTRMIRDFIWDDGINPRIALENLYCPMDKGGLNLLNIKARNEAIELTWLRLYLDLTPKRPTWAIITDILISAAAPLGTSAIARMNMFIQKWKPFTRGPQAMILGDETLRMLKIAKKYNTNLGAIRLSTSVKAKLPSWYHPGTPPRPLTNVATKCLLKKHKVSTVVELIKLANKAQAQNRGQDHIPALTCICRDCVHERIGGCKNPHACAEEALEHLREIAPKYNPLEIDLHDNLSLMHRRKMSNKNAQDSGGDTLFDPTITCRNSLAECFRTLLTRINYHSHQLTANKHGDLPSTT